MTLTAIITLAIIEVLLFSFGEVALLFILITTIILAIIQIELAVLITLVITAEVIVGESKAENLFFVEAKKRKLIVIDR